MSARPAVVYDGECSLCRHSVEWARRRDREQAVEFLPFQDPTCAIRFPAVPRARCLRAVQFVAESGEVFSGADAVRETLARLPGTRGWAPLLRFPPLRALCRLGYEIVARVRPRDSCGRSSG